MVKFTEYSIEHETIDPEFPEVKDYILYGHYYTTHTIKLSIPIFASEEIPAVAQMYEHITGEPYYVN